MTNKQLKNLKDTLWATAYQLRANSGLKSSEYAEPILGLIFLRFAECKYAKYEAEIKAEYEKTKGTRIERGPSMKSLLRNAVSICQMKQNMSGFSHGLKART